MEEIDVVPQESSFRRKGGRMKLAFFSSCPEIWGGSEELWSSAARRFAQNRNEVEIYKTGVSLSHPKFQALERTGCRVTDARRVTYPRSLRILRRLLPSGWWGVWKETPLEGLLRRRWTRPPDLAVISQGENFDGVHFGEICRKSGVPYVLICQKASDAIWPDDERRKLGRRAFLGARKCYFVSEHNLDLTQSQLGLTLPHAQVVRNPVLAGHAGPLPWPAESGDWRLACVARLWLLDKGQDLLLQVLARPQWRTRNLTVAFYGAGVHEDALKGLAQRLELKSVEFMGSVSDIEGVWRSHHGLVLPSRAEGLPLAMVEAMMCGRPCIVTPVGGNAELASRPEVGFVAADTSLDSLDAVLERAWEQRHQWQAMGLAAADHVRAFVGGEPEDTFYQLLGELLPS